MEHPQEVRNLSGEVNILSYRPVFKGPYSTVYHGKLKDSNELVAIKVLNAIRNTALHTIRRKIERERQTWSLLQHPNILPLYGFVDDDEHFQPFGAFISPWCQRGDMAQYIQEQAPSAPLNERFELWKGVVAGVKHLHTHDPLLVHGDLKPSNVLIDDYGKALICDFGLVKVILEEGSSGMTTTTAHTGTLRYLAYELVTEEEPVPTMASDIYATGCIGLETIFGETPYSNHANGNNLLWHIRIDIQAGTAPASRPADLTSLLSPLWNAILWCWAYEPFLRPQASALNAHLEHVTESVYSELDSQSSSYDHSVNSGAEEDHTPPPSRLVDSDASTMAMRLAPDNTRLRSVIQALLQGDKRQEIPDDTYILCDLTSNGPRYTCGLFKRPGHLCAESLDRDDRLKHHLQFHLGITPYSCTSSLRVTPGRECDRMFSSPAARDTHVRNKDHVTASWEERVITSLRVSIPRNLVRTSSASPTLPHNSNKATGGVSPSQRQKQSPATEVTKFPSISTSNLASFNAQPTVSPTYYSPDTRTTPPNAYSLHRETIRTASSLLIKHLSRPPPPLRSQDWHDVDVRLLALSRLERIWGRGGRGGSSTLNSGSTLGGGEERERQIFRDTIRDGYVLCALINKFRPGTVARPDPKEDGFAKSSNVTKFLAGALRYGISKADLFMRDDLLEATSESLSRVARTIISLVKISETALLPSDGGEGVYMSTRSDTIASPKRLDPRAGSPSSPGQQKRWLPILPPPRSPLRPAVSSGVSTARKHPGEDSQMEISPSAPELPRVPFPRTIFSDFAIDATSPPSAGLSQLSALLAPAEAALPEDVTTADSIKGNALRNVSPQADLEPSTFLSERYNSAMDMVRTRARKERPNLVDDDDVRPGRSRFESTTLANLGAGGDALNRGSSLSVNAIRPLIVREEGKLPMHCQIGACIGRGHIGAVYRAINLNTGQTVAVKRIGLQDLSEDERSNLMKELDVLKRLSHPSIVKYEGMDLSNDTLSIVLEYVESSPFGQTIKAFLKLNEPLVASYITKILEGLQYLHTSHVVHCDLKAANILTTKNGNIKLSDFGVSLGLYARALEEIKDGIGGTPNWMAPEVIELKGPSTASDIWSLGCTAIELLTGHPPYHEIQSALSVMFRIVEDPSPPIPEVCSPLMEDFLKQCFKKNPMERPSAEMLFEHPWLKTVWGERKRLRPQETIPFLRRVSVDLDRNSPREVGNSTPASNLPPTPLNPLQPNSTEGPSRSHSFTRTTFSRAVMCRVCLQSVKRSAVLCDKCGLIAHARCAFDAPAGCDIREQLLQYAQYSQPSFGQEASTPTESPAVLAPVATPTTPVILPQELRQSEAPTLGPPKLLDRLLGPWKRSNKLPE